MNHVRPEERADVRFDFLFWRLLRRELAAALRAHGASADAKARDDLFRLAARLDTERFGEREAGTLRAYIERVCGVPDVDTVQGALDALNGVRTDVPAEPVTYPDIRPRWDLVRAAGHFAGDIGGVVRQAWLPEAAGLVPAYALVWGSAPNEEAEPLTATITEPAVTWGPVVWDWLVARRLTLRCLSGAAPWPGKDVLALQS